MHCFLQVKIEVESLFEGEDLSETLTRAKFEELNMDLFRSTLKPVQKVLEDADMQKKDIDEIVLVITNWSSRTFSNRLVNLK